MQDVTPVDRIREDPKVDREVTLFGYSRGTNIKPGARVHMAGVGDFVVSPPLLSPCPHNSVCMLTTLPIAICSWLDQSKSALLLYGWLPVFKLCVPLPIFTFR